MLKSIAAAAVLACAAVPAAAVTISVNQAADTTNVPFFQTTQNVFIGSAGFLSSAVLNVTSLSADDAAIVSVNGTAIFGTGIFGPGAGNFYFTSAGASTPFTFGANGSGGSFTAPFVLGNNTVTVTVNNNNAGINTNDGPLTTGPGSLAFVGNVSFVPEPAAWGLMIAGFAMTGAAMRRRPVTFAA